MVENQDWAKNSIIKENPYFVEGMTPEEYDREREYYLKNYDRIRSGELEYSSQDYKKRVG